MWYDRRVMSPRALVHLVVLCLLLIAVSGFVFYSQSGKRHLMAAMVFDGIARQLEEGISPGLMRLADLYDSFGWDTDDTGTGSMIREANEVLTIKRCIKAESDVLRTWAAGDREGTRQYIDDWYAEGIQEALRRGLYPAGLRRFMKDNRQYLEFIRLRNQYIEPETHRWKLGGMAPAPAPEG